MFIIIWEYQAKAGAEAEFERIYGPNGDWANFFALDENYLGTELLRTDNRVGHFVTLDRWVSRLDYEHFRHHHEKQYREIDNLSDALTEKEKLVGTYESIE